MRKLLLGWEFHGLDSEGSSRGIIIGFSTNNSLINWFSLPSRLYTKLYSKELDTSLTFHNLYGPYEGKELFWDKIFVLNCIRLEKLIVGGDLNMTLSREKI